MIKIEFRNTNNQLLEDIDLGDVSAGEESTPIPIRVYNDYGRTGTERNLDNVVLFLLDNYGLEKGRAIQECWFRYSIGTSNDTAQPLVIQTDWKPCGKGYPIVLGPLQWGTFRTVFLKVAIPVNAISSNISISLVASFGSYSTVIDPMEYEFSDDGIVNEEDNLELALRSGFDPSTTNNYDVTIGAGEALVHSLPMVFDDTSLGLGNTDGSNNVLGAGEYYLARIYLNSEGELQYVKSNKGATEYPSLTETGIDICYVTVRYGGSVDIVDMRTFTEFGAILRTNTIKIGSGRAVFSHYYIDIPYGAVFNLPTSGALSIGLNTSGYIVTEPDFLLYVYDANTLYDYRHLIGRGTNYRGGNIRKYQALVYTTSQTVAPCSSTDSPYLFAGIAECDSYSGCVYIIKKGLCIADVSGEVTEGDTLTLGNNGTLTVGGNPVAIALKKCGSRWLVKLL